MQGLLPSLRGLYSLGLALALGLLVLLGLLGVLGGLLPELDLINHFRPWLLLAGLLALPALAAAGRGWRPPLACLAGLSLVLQAPFVLPTALAGSGGEGGGGQAISLVTLNLRYANGDAEPTAEFIERLRPDLVFLQEVAPQHLAVLQRRLPALLPHAVHCVELRYCNLAILSRFPLQDAAASYLGRRESLPPLPRPIEGWRKAEIELVRDHGAASGLTARALLPGGRHLILFDTHLSWPTPAEAQRRQFRWVADRLADLGAGPLVLAGDFNSTPWSYGLRGFETAIALRRVTQGLFTFPTEQVLPLPILAIDQVYLSGEARVEEVERGPDVGSDHFPVLVRFATASD